MANKSKKAQKTNKNLIIGICAAVAAVVVIVVAVVLLNKGSTIDDSYFVSDGTKYVLTVDLSDSTTDTEDEDENYAPEKMHSVYTYEGDTVTGLKTYYEYSDAASAKAAYDAMLAEISDGNESELGSIEVTGKYLVIIADAEDYADMTVSDVKEQIEFMEMLQNMNLDDNDTDYLEEDVEIDEDEE